ncbi:hypothetical protein [Maliponia aquimaris]|uniref:Uncharacterized protein n=1 Tax=Maliponia aquimaris TaxID=1673631 RepID=A0A238L0U0_9RHOB|nr:hypothetical protein [Maliponia aquimaris]SMX48704.1 hypothetical protein MAA8898_04051 [Maliponia aquimaris]
MSAPSTNLTTQTRRHRPALFAIAAVSFVAGALLTGLVGHVMDEGSAPEGAEVQIDGRTGLPASGD